jgi:biotin carboxylase
MDVAHDGGIFTTRSLPREAAETRPLAAINREVISAFGMVRGVAHTEFIRARGDGRWYFLETSARVGGAFIVNVIEAASGLNLWREWARLEIAGEDTSYHLPTVQDRFAGLVLTLAREERPDTSRYDADEIVQRIDRPYHAGLILASRDASRIEALLDDYVERFRYEFMATLPAPESPMA